MHREEAAGRQLRSMRLLRQPQWLLTGEVGPSSMLLGLMTHHSMRTSLLSPPLQCRLCEEIQSLFTRYQHVLVWYDTDSVHKTYRCAY